jgi:hypothetical protein
MIPKAPGLRQAREELGDFMPRAKDEDRAVAPLPLDGPHDARRDLRGKIENVAEPGQAQPLDQARS